MLTPNDASGEGSFTKYDCGSRRRVVFDFLRQAVTSGRRDIRLLRELLPGCGVQYLPFGDAEYFQDATRRVYFNTLPTEWLTRSVVFFDPDIGLQTGTVGYMRGNGLEKYLMYSELSGVAARGSQDAIIVVYQHLQRDASKRTGDIERRLRELATHLRTPSVWPVQATDVAFFVAVRNRVAAARVMTTLCAHALRHQLRFFECAAESRQGLTAAAALAPRVRRAPKPADVAAAMATFTEVPPAE